MRRFVRIYLVPGAVLQSVMVGGGYGTGREIVEYFTRFGAGGGMLGIGVAAVSVAVIFALSLEISRAFSAYDYRSFFRVLLGPFWVLYEVLILALIVLVLAVIAAAAGGVIEEELGLPSALGVALVLAMVVLLTFYGRDVVTRMLAYWSLLLYLVFLTYLAVVVAVLGAPMNAALSAFAIADGWFVSGLQYVFYNVTAIPLILFAARGIETRRQAFGAGVIGALVAVLPALFLHLSFVAGGAAVIEAELPVYAMLGHLGIGVLTAAYLVVLFGTFIETGVGDVQGVLERVQAWWIERTGAGLAPRTCALVAAGVMVLAGLLSSLGVVDLIASGYGTMSWGFLAVYVAPLLTIGIWRIVRSQRSTSPTRSRRVSRSC
jgi:uncharacterized membrane protein YkvI